MKDGDWSPQASSPTGRVKGVYKPLTSIWTYRFLFTPKTSQSIKIMNYIKHANTVNVSA